MICIGFSVRIQYFEVFRTTDWGDPDAPRKEFGLTVFEPSMVSDDFIDGYFIALHAETVLGIKSLGWPR